MINSCVPPHRPSATKETQLHLFRGPFNHPYIHIYAFSKEDSKKIICSLDLSACFDPNLLLLYIKCNKNVQFNSTAAGIQFWRTLAQRLKASFNTYEYLKGYPVVVIRKRGVNSKLSSIALISHIDVAPVADEVIIISHSNYYTVRHN